MDSTKLSNVTLLCDKCDARLTVDCPPTPPVAQELLQNNYVPSDAEISQIASLIDGVERDVCRYDSEIRRLPNTLITLKTRREELQRYRDEYKTLLSPIRKVPYDVLHIIFSMCCSDFSGCLSMPKSRGIQSPRIIATTLALSQTCTFWRKIVANVPHLWSTMSVNLAVITDDRHDALNLVELYLERSSSTLLTLDVFAFNRYGEHVESLSNWGWPALSLLLAQDYRWKDVSFDLHWYLYTGMDSYIDGLKWNNNHTRGSLQSLSVKWYGHPLPGETNDFLQSELFRHTPALHSLSLQSFDPRFSLPFFQLRSVTILHVDDFADIPFLLNTCSHLQSVDIRADCDVSDENVSMLRLIGIAKVIVQSLESLKLDFQYAGTAEAVFSTLTLPSLTTFDLQVRTVRSLTCTQSLIDMLNRSSPDNLRALALSGAGISMPDCTLLDILSMAPQLRHLSLKAGTTHVGMLTDRFFDALRYNSRTPTSIMLPYLTCLKIHFIQEYPSSKRIPPDAIFTLVNSRRPSDDSVSVNTDDSYAWLESFDFSASIHMPSSCVPTEWTVFESRLRALESKGLQLTWLLLPVLE